VYELSIERTGALNIGETRIGNVNNEGDQRIVPGWLEECIYIAQKW